MRHPVGKMLTKQDNSQIRYNFLTENKMKKTNENIEEGFFLSFPVSFRFILFFWPVVVSLSAQLFIAYAFYFVCHRHKVHRTLFPAIFERHNNFHHRTKLGRASVLRWCCAPLASIKLARACVSTIDGDKNERAHQSTQCAIFQYTNTHYTF